MPLTWSHTFEPGPDFVAHDGEQMVGRIRKHQFGTTRGRWFWAANGIQMDPKPFGFQLYGEVETKAEAVEAVETTWERAQAWSAETGQPLLLSKGYVPPVRSG